MARSARSCGRATAPRSCATVSLLSLYWSCLHVTDANRTREQCPSGIGFPDPICCPSASPCCSRNSSRTSLAHTGAAPELTHLKQVPPDAHPLAVLLQPPSLALPRRRPAPRRPPLVVVSPVVDSLPDGRVGTPQRARGRGRGRHSDWTTSSGRPPRTREEGPARSGARLCGRVAGDLCRARFGERILGPVTA